MSRIIEKYGIVVLLDALGIQNATISESKKFVRFLKEDAIGSIHYLDGYTSGSEIEEHFKKVKPVMRTFGDTFLITWEVPKELNINEYFEAISSAIRHIILSGIEQNILFRGAITIGTYLESDTSIIGPAIADVASWYEQANWFGCITTPLCTQHVNLMYKKDQSIGYLMKKYDVPLKPSNKTMKVWCVDWSKSASVFGNTDVMKWYYENISKIQIPIGTEDKYFNSESFLKFCLDETNEI